MFGVEMKFAVQPFEERFEGDGEAWAPIMGLVISIEFTRVA
jgi:hypothetical protein